MQRRWAALQLRRLRLMRGDLADEEEASAAASEVQPDASAFGMQHLQPVDGGGGGGADDSDGSLAPYGQDDSDYTSDDEVGYILPSALGHPNMQAPTVMWSAMQISAAASFSFHSC
jgi:hypothetical protein